MLLAVDPGLRACGVALFREGSLLAAGLAVGSKDGNMRLDDERASVIRKMAATVRSYAACAPDELVIECPRIYQASHQRGSKRGADSNDLIDLAAVVGAILVSFPGARTRIVHPAEWKQQVPKAIHHERARARLSEDELATIPKLAASKLHNVLDAVALGLWACGRMVPRISASPVAS